ncbi:PP34, Calyx, Polyhedron envelope protein [Perigonia lusca single nucleopolyhedrovirus]|uniref:PP34, Calyx, Polyhedron envelope protein n=1 Tax=Perigonia lusca single nucleopolyhedrovirus TaxID=1675865 RepID=A0A0M3N050_9ABAC|nr:PP34, Calyx, Polyhedron envelope protein [Perigonia lusca single nucleopolyhedrovirus]AKN80609.1 PP34, Calyx, Polyhedron envelope protein [Perigonia lusca single nucleopolyhedrovirus]
MSYNNILVRKIQDCNVSVFVEPSWVAWVSAEEIIQLLRLPHNILQSIPPRHKKCWIDFRSGQCGGGSIRHENSKVFIDLWGLGLLCTRITCNLADYLMTQFIAEIYKEWACIEANSAPVPPPPFDCNRPTPDCRPPPSDCHDRELLERLNRQSDLIVNTLNQLSINSSNQNLEITNQLNAIRLQNITITGQLASILDILETQLGSITEDINRVLGDFTVRLEALLAALNTTITQLQDTIRSELTNINAILGNLTSSVTNINATLNNILQALNNLNVGDLTAILNDIQANINQILEILTPEILGKKQ